MSSPYPSAHYFILEIRRRHALELEYLEVQNPIFSVRWQSDSETLLWIPSEEIVRSHFIEKCLPYFHFSEYLNPLIKVLLLVQDPFHNISGSR